MHSPADPARRALEVALRALSLAGLATLLWLALRPRNAGDDERVGSAELQSALHRWTVHEPAGVHVMVDSVPGAHDRDWLAALAHAGTRLGWSQRVRLTPTALVAEAIADPRGGTRVFTVANGASALSVRDDGGLVDSIVPRVEAAGRGAAAGAARGSVSASVDLVGRRRVEVGAPGARAAATLPDSLLLRPVLVLGSAGWEAKFTIAALEERGWQVAARLRVAPNADVRQGALGAIDTARYAAVIVLDSAGASDAATIATYARSGGGVVLAGGASRLAGMREMAAGAAGPRGPGLAGGIASLDPRAGLAAYPITRLRPDAVTIEERHGAPTLAARRVDAGRVIQVAYDDTWRWRMLGGDDAVGAHRDWWSRVVGAVAYAPTVGRVARTDADLTPYASLVAAIGDPAPAASTVGAGERGERWRWVIMLLVVAALLGEWASRRLRGVR